MHAIVEDAFYDCARAPVTLIFGEDAGRRGHVARLVAQRGGRLAGGVGIAGAAARLDAQAVAAIVVLDLRDAPAADALLARLAEGVAARRYDLLVIAPVALLDAVSAHVAPEAAAVLIDPDERTIGEALDALMAPADHRVAEGREEADRRRLADLSEEVGRIARALAALAVEAPAPVPASDIGMAEELAFLRTQIRLRRLRAVHFDRALFADPAWDMLLDLRVAALEGRRVAVSSLCIAAAVPPTTALRWIGAMASQGLFERHADPDDGRRAFVALTPRAQAALSAYAAAGLRVMAG